MAKARIVVMVPEVIEREFIGNINELAEWARQVVTHEYPQPTQTLHHSGPSNGEYYAKIMECTLDEPSKVSEVVVLEEFIAPGAV